jgi:hypothetical protein
MAYLLGSGIEKGLIGLNSAAGGESLQNQLL